MIRRQILGLIGGGVAALALVGCGAKHDASDTGVVFATQKNGVPFLAQARGEFEKRLKARGIGWAYWAVLAGSVAVFAWFYPILSAAELSDVQAFNTWMWREGWR